MSELFKEYSADEIDEANGKIKRIEIRKKEFNLLKEKLEKHFNFKITEYIIDDILDYETYHHTCLMINLAVVNNRMTADDGEILKAGLKILFKIQSSSDRFDRSIYMDTFDYDAWYEKYSTFEIVDLKKHLSKEDFELLKRLNIKIKDKIYTEQEFEILDMELLGYYIDEDMNEEELKESKPLPEGVTREEYNKLIEKLSNISSEYNF